MKRILAVALLSLSVTAFVCGSDSPQADEPVEVPTPVAIDSQAPVDTVVVDSTAPVGPIVIVTPGPAPGFCIPGSECDTAGSAVLAREVNPSVSTFQIKNLKFYAAGDSVAFILCAKTTKGAPVAGVPATVRVKQTARLLAGDGLTLTGEDGCAEAKGVVEPEDLRKGPGSNIVNGYLGGRVLNTVKVLPDSI